MDDNMSLEALKIKYCYNDCTTVMKQYLDVKFVNMDCLVLFRMGDFYELFFDDAVNASNCLGILLTKRGKCGEDDIQMCGVPYHALELYLNKLIDEGYKVAICDQTESPMEAKKRGGYKAIVNREVVRIITPGTIVEESLISGSAPNYLASLSIMKNKAAICYLDLSTSEINIIEVEKQDAYNEIFKIAPKELLLAENLRGSELANNIGSLKFTKLTFQVDSFFASNKCEKIILNFYKLADISAIGQISSIQVSSIGGVLEYLILTQKQNIPKLPLPRIINPQNLMIIDAVTRRNLEISTNSLGQRNGSLLSTIDHTITKNGSRLLYQFISAPLTNIEQINQRLELTNLFYQNKNLTENIRALLKNVSDVEKCLTRLSMNRGSGRDLLSIKETLVTAAKIKGQFINILGINLPTKIEKLTEPLAGNQELHDLIDQSIRQDAPSYVNEGGYIIHDYHPKIAELYNVIDNGKECIETLRKKYQREANIENIKISHNNIIGLFIEVSNKHSHKLNNPQFIHKHTTINTVRYTTSELQKLESDMINARTLVFNLEREVFDNIVGQVIDKSTFLLQMSKSLSLIDVFTNLGYAANEYDYCRPNLREDLTLNIQDGRHPVIEKGFLKSSQSFTKNNCFLSNEERMWLLTGPNMAGKSTFLRQNALIAILAQMGSFVPATRADIGIIDKIFSRIGSGDDLMKGQSTFMVEMLETSAILAQSTNRSLVILDEVGRGTSTYDGVAIAWSVLEYIHEKIACRCLFATHYHELTQMADNLVALSNYTVEIEELEDNILFLHRIKLGAADKSYGIHVASLAGLPTELISRANQILQKFEQNNVKRNLSESMGNIKEYYQKQKIDIPARINKLEEEFNKIIPDQLTPREALDLIYKLKSL